MGQKPFRVRPAVSFLLFWGRGSTVYQIQSWPFLGARCPDCFFLFAFIIVCLFLSVCLSSSFDGFFFVSEALGNGEVFLLMQGRRDRNDIVMFFFLSLKRVFDNKKDKKKSEHKKPHATKLNRP